MIKIKLIENFTQSMNGHDIEFNKPTYKIKDHDLENKQFSKLY